MLQIIFSIKMRIEFITLRYFNLFDLVLNLTYSDVDKEKFHSIKTNFNQGNVQVIHVEHRILYFITNLLKSILFYSKLFFIDDGPVTK